MERRVVVAGLVIAIIASLAGFPFEPLGAHAWAGTFFVLWALGLFVSAALLALASVRKGDDLAAVGFGAVGLYGFGTTLNGSLLARGLPESSVGLQPGIWGMLALGLLVLGGSGRFVGWVRVAGFAAALGHGVAAVAVLFGAEMPHTGAAPSDWPPLVVALSKVALWVTLIGWIVDVRREAGATTRPQAAGGGGAG